MAGDHLARNYRFDEAVAMTRRAVTLDPANAQAQADLGLHLMRTGDEPAARVSLEAAYEGDPFRSSVLTTNLLTLLDELDKFETITDGKIVMKFHPGEVGVMREYALPLAKQALETLEKHYQFSAQGPILVEMFPKHDDFAVRTLGLPGMIGALGACFGRVVTLDSPKARPPGEFSWGETLWHEMAHVITLQMSNNRLPRWLSEGASVFEERRARPQWGREMDVAFAQALDEGKLLKLADLNEGFSDPRMISLAYYQSSLVVEHLIETDGSVWFGGANVTAANGGSRARLYAPSPWEQGSSNSHFDENTYPTGTVNALMTPFLDNGESIHEPGPLTLALFRDIGWTTTAPATPDITVANVSRLEGTGVNSVVKVKVRLSVASTSDVTVTYSTADGAAVAPGDYKAKTGTLVIPAGATSKAVKVTVVGDAAVESNETFTVNIANAVGGVITDATGVVTIQNDD
jgi:hypothetical protein